MGWALRCAKTAKEILRDIRAIYRVELPDDDAGREVAERMLEYLAHAPNATRRSENFLDLWCPWMREAERRTFLKRAFTSPPPRYTADENAECLGTTYERRQRLRHTQIGAIDVPKEERQRRTKERKRELDRQRRRRERQAKRKQTRKQYLASARARRQEIRASGLSKATWYRVRQVGSPRILLKRRDPTCLTEQAERTRRSHPTKETHLRSET